jgi:hypothetical protein
MFELLGILMIHYAWLATWLASAGLAGLAVQSVLLDFGGGEPHWPNAELAVCCAGSAGG